MLDLVPVRRDTRAAAVTVLEVVGEAEHGTRRAYRHGCHCPECCAANAAATAHSRRSPKGYVPAGMVRRHVLALHAEGVSYYRIAALAGVNSRTVQRIATGEARAVTPANRSKILAVTGSGAGYKNDTAVTQPAESTSDGQFDDPLAALRLLLSDPDALAWKADAECLPSRLDLSPVQVQQWFFPLRGDSLTPALRICGRCPVWQPCLTFALANGEEGVWGRTGGAHRREIVHHDVTVPELADAFDGEPDLSMPDAIRRVVDAREAVAS